MSGLLGALVLLGLLAVWPAAAAEPVRVSLGDGLRTVEIGAADLVTISAAGTRRFGIPAGRLIRIVPSRVGLEMTWGKARAERASLAMAGVRLETRRSALRVGSRDYSGVLEVWRSGDGLLLLVNEIPLEDYVAGTVRAESSEKWPAEALRAIAVAARTYAVFQQQRNASKPYHLVASSKDQNYAGWIAENSPAWEATRATAGQVLSWQGSVFPAFYHSDSGGYTEPPQTIFSGDGIPPLPGIRDEFSLDSPNYAWATTLSLRIIGDRLRQGGVDIGEVTGLTVLERSASLRIVRLAVEHSRGATTLKGTDFRRLIGYDVIKSTLFVPAPGPDGTIRFEGRGWGHGVGLSQFGAKGMADRGYAYPQILAHYYPGTSLATLK